MSCLIWAPRVDLCRETHSSHTHRDMLRLTQAPTVDLGPEFWFVSPDETLINSITKDAMFQIWITPSQARLAAKWYAAGQAKKIGTVSAHVRARLALQVRSGASSGRAAQHISSWTHCRAKACTRCEEEECSEGHESGSMQVCGPHATVVRLSFLIVRKWCLSLRAVTFGRATQAPHERPWLLQPPGNFSRAPADVFSLDPCVSLRVCFASAQPHASAARKSAHVIVGAVRIASRPVLERGHSVLIGTCSVALGCPCSEKQREQCSARVGGEPEARTAGHARRGVGGYVSVDGRCKTLDACANGYARSEGVGALVLRQRDGAMLALRGSAVRQDGRSASLTAPNGSAQRTWRHR